MNTPTTTEAAAETFRCESYACTLAGASCARQHVRAVQTQDARRQHCIGCEAGAARARLLNAGPVVCQVPGGDGTPCGGEPEQGAAYCRKHRAHRNMPPGPTGTADKFEPKTPMRAPSQSPRLPAKSRPAQTQPARQREVFRPTGEVRLPPESKPKPLPRGHTNRAKVLGIAPSPCAKCGTERKAVGVHTLAELAPWCGTCLWRARRAMKARGVEITPASTVAWFSAPEDERIVRPKLVADRPPCARCERPRGHGRRGYAETAAWCRGCVDVARQTLYRRGVSHPTPAQVAEVLPTLARREYAGDPMAEIRAAVARALSAGLPMDEILEELRAAGMIAQEGRVAA